MESQALWKGYREGTDPTARERLMMRHLSLVHHVARQIQRTSRVDTEYAELVSAGTIGLIQAIESFDLSRGLAFSTYAAPRIRGAILDDHRRRDPVPHSIRRKEREIHRAEQRLAAASGRAPREDEVAKELEIDVKKLRRWHRQIRQATHVSLDGPVDPTSENRVTMEAILAGEEGDDIEESLTRKEQARMLREEIDKLNEQQRVVLTLYYLQEMKLREIAKILGVTESRASQIRAEGVQTILTRLAHLREGAAA